MSLITAISTVTFSKTDYLPPQAINFKPSVGAALAEKDNQFTKLFSPSAIRYVSSIIVLSFHQCACIALKMVFLMIFM